MTQHEACCRHEELLKKRDKCQYLSDLPQSIEINCATSTPYPPLTTHHSPLTLTSAYWLLLGSGLVATKQYQAGRWCSSVRLGACTLFFIGRNMVGEMELTALQALGALLQAVLDEPEKLGIGQIFHRLTRPASRTRLARRIFVVHAKLVRF